MFSQLVSLYPEGQRAGSDAPGAPRPLSVPCLGRPRKQRQGAVRSPEDERCFGVVQRRGPSLGSLMIREIDKGFRNSRVGIVLVTPALLKSTEAEGVAEQELAVLLSTRRVIPVLHEVGFDDLNNVSPMLASHAGLSTKDSSLNSVAAKVAAAAAALLLPRVTNLAACVSRPH